MEFAITKLEEKDTVIISLDFSKDGLTESEYNGLFEFEGEFDEFLFVPENAGITPPFISNLYYSVVPEDMDEVAYSLIRDMLTQLASVFEWRVHAARVV